MKQHQQKGTTYRFAKEDKKDTKILFKQDLKKYLLYKLISTSVDYTDDPFEALSLQDDLQCKYTGGTVLHLYMKRYQALKLVKKMVKM